MNKQNAIIVDSSKGSTTKISEILNNAMVMNALREECAKQTQQANASKETAIHIGGSDNVVMYKVDLERLTAVSHAASQQQKEVSMTPYMKNALQKFGDLAEGERLSYDAPVTKAEEYITRRQIEWLNKQFGHKVTVYDRSLTVMDSRHYGVDNWRNLKPGVEMRDIVPGQQESREKGFQTFREPPPSTPNLYSDKMIQISLRYTLEEMPQRIVASDQFKDWSGPFENKKTQTSWPFGYRDDVIVSADNDKEGMLKPYYGMTYGQMCVDIAKTTPVEDTIRMGVNMGYGRNQRGKGRPLIAMARIPAVIFNRMTSMETEQCKLKCPFFIGYNDRQTLKLAMEKQARWVEDNHLAMENFDYHAFDQSISSQWMALGGAVWSHLAADREAKAIVYYRTLMSLSGLLVDGIADPKSKEVAAIFGRMPSGFIETNKTENVINAIASLAALLHQDQQWINNIGRRSYYPRMYMGDDCLITYDPTKFSHDDYVNSIAEYGFEVHPDKGEFGAFFLQNRLFKDADGNEIMAYPVTRVVRSLFMKEKSRGLGPAGWTLAAWSQLANIAEYKPGLAFARDLVCEFDDEQLMLNKTISQIISMVQQEDKEAKDENKRAFSTFDIINDGDPGKVQITGKSSSKYLSELQKTIREA